MPVCISTPPLSLSLSCFLIPTEATAHWLCLWRCIPTTSPRMMIKRTETPSAGVSPEIMCNMCEEATTRGWRSFLRRFRLFASIGPFLGRRWCEGYGCGKFSERASFIPRSSPSLTHPMGTWKCFSKRPQEQNMTEQNKKTCCICATARPIILSH